MSARLCAALAVTFLLAGALPAASAQRCGAIKTAIGACHNDMVEVMWAISGGQGAGDALASKLAASEKCCKAAQVVFEKSWMDVCECNSAVTKFTTETTPAALKAMFDMVKTKCAVPDTTTLQPFSLSCNTGASLQSASIGIMSTLPPIGGTGSICWSTKCSKPMCGTKVKPEKLQKFKDKCNANPFIVSLSLGEA